MESLHSFGLCLFMFRVLPCLDTVRCLLLMNSLCQLPAILRLFATKRPEEPRRKIATIVLDFIALLMQASAIVVSLISLKANCTAASNSTSIVSPTIKTKDNVIGLVFAANDTKHRNAHAQAQVSDGGKEPRITSDQLLLNMSWEVPVSLILISVKWWENFVDKSLKFGCLELPIKEYKDTLYKVRVKSYIIVSAWKVALTFGFAFLLIPNFSFLHQAFGKLLYGDASYSYINTSIGPKVSLLSLTTTKSPIPVSTGMPISPFMAILPEKFLMLESVNCSVYNVTNVSVMYNETICEQTYVDPWRDYVTYMPLIIQIVSSGLCYYFARLACKLCMQRFSFAVPLCLATPISVGVIIAICHLQPEKIVLISNFLQWACTGQGIDRQWLIWHLGIGFGLWWVSQLWVTRYIWTPKAPRLAFTER